MTHDLIRRMENLGSPRIVVVGDLILDRYIWGYAERISQEAPVPLLRADQREHRLGGAASVATMLRALGAQVRLIGGVGHDPEAVGRAPDARRARDRRPMGRARSMTGRPRSRNATSAARKTGIRSR